MHHLTDPLQINKLIYLKIKFGHALLMILIGMKEGSKVLNKNFYAYGMDFIMIHIAQ